MKKIILVTLMFLSSSTHILSMDNNDTDEQLLNNAYDKVTKTPTPTQENFSTTENTVDTLEKLKEWFNEALAPRKTDAIKRISPAARVFTIMCAEAEDIVTCFFWGFIPNLVTDTTLKQKTWANVAGVARVALNYRGRDYRSTKKEFDTISTSLHAGSYLCGALSGTLTRAVLNKTIIPLTVCAFKKGMVLLRK
jgi:hypothetical protein